MKRDKIVITGLGAIAPNGTTTNEFWNNLTESKSGIGPITYFDTTGHRVSIAGELSNFSPEKILNPKEIRKLDPFSIYALVASNEAIMMSGIDLNKINLERTGVTIGTVPNAINSTSRWHFEPYPRKANPYFALDNFSIYSC